MPDEIEDFTAYASVADELTEKATKDQLADCLWTQSAGDVNDSAISTLIARIRRKLGESARQPRYLETKTGHGFVLHRAAFVDAAPPSDKETP